MSVRPGDWSPLAGSDPVPGDPEVVTSMARHYAATATEISRQVARLERLADLPDWEGEAARGFAVSAGDLAEELGKAHRRFDDLADAVQSWVEPLTRAQADSLVALAAAQEAEQAASSTAGSLLTGVAEPTEEQERDQRRREGDHGAAVDALATAKRHLRDVLDDLDDAAGRVADGIGDAGDHHADSRWDRFKGWVSDHAGVLKVIAEVAAWVATGLAVIALFITSPVWAPVVGAIALVAGVVALVVHSALAASGEGSWTDVALDVFAIATFGIGRIAIRGVRAAVSGTRAAAITSVRTPAVAAHLAAHGTTLRLTGWALRTRLPLGPLRGVAMDTAHAVGRGASRAGDEAVSRMAGLTVPRVSGIQALHSFDRELAGQLAQLAQLGVHVPAQAAAAAARAERLRTLFRVTAGVDLLVDKAATAAAALGAPSIKPDLRWEIPSFDVPGFPPPVIIASRFALPGSR